MTVPVHLQEPAHADPAGAHVVRFYEDGQHLAETAAAHLGAALAADGAAILMATGEHAASVQRRLAADGHDLEALRAKRRLVELPAAETLDRLLYDGWPDPERFEGVAGHTLAQTIARTKKGPVAAFGDLVALLAARGNHGAAVQLERLWNQLGERLPFRLLCAYPLESFGGTGHEKALAAVCELHGRAVPTESHTGLASDRARTNYVIGLQRKALEVDREHDRRREAEEALHRRERELAEVLEFIADGVLDIDPDGRVRGANRAYLAHLDTTPADHFGRDVRTFLFPPGRFDDVWARLVRGNVVRGESGVFTTPDGRRRRASIENAVLRMVGRTLTMRWFLRIIED